MNAIKDEYEDQIEEMKQNNVNEMRRENELDLIIKQRDEMKDHYMALNDKYATVLLELNEMKIQQINNENEPSEADLYTLSLQEEIDQVDALKASTLSLDDVLGLVQDLKENIVDQKKEDDLESEDQKELDEYLKRVESMHGQFDSNLQHITHCENAGQSESENDTQSEDYGLLQ